MPLNFRNHNTPDKRYSGNATELPNYTPPMGKDGKRMVQKRAGDVNSNIPNDNRTLTTACHNGNHKLCSNKKCECNCHLSAYDEALE